MEPTVQFYWLRFFPAEGAFYLVVGKVLRRKRLGGRTRLIKAEEARPKCEGDGASNEEAVFASQEEVKPPSMQAAGAR
ncbi:hypothetical protein COD67_18585 [Bacillus cereus]|nr:hypothetical protein COI89_07510 [Bacillus cereus]PGU64393.1 hypothetical protein COD67_18585 [Bacillus cereus]